MYLLLLELIRLSQLSSLFVLKQKIQKRTKLITRHKEQRFWQRLFRCMIQMWMRGQVLSFRLIQTSTVNVKQVISSKFISHSSSQ